MAQNPFYPNFQPPTGFFGWLGGIRRAVFGSFGGGKFRYPRNTYLPVGQRLTLQDTSPGALMEVAQNVPHLNMVISRGAEIFSCAAIKHLNKDGEEIPIEKSLVLQFLKKPNKLQTLSEYLYNFYVYNAVYNKTFQHKITKLSFEKIPAAMWLLPSGWMKINITGKMYRQAKLEGIIESFEMQGDPVKYEVDKIIYMGEGIGNSPLDPISRIHALTIPLSNIMAALKSINVIWTEKGAIGMITPMPHKEGNEPVPYDPAESLRIRDEYQRESNLDSLHGHMHFPNTPMQFVPITFPVSQLMFFEGIEDAFATICGTYSHDRDIYPSVKGATNENKEAGLRATIQNAMQPLADKLCEQLTAHLIDESTGEYLQASYEHLPSMQADQLKEAQTAQINGLRLSREHEEGVITIEQYATAAGVDYEIPADSAVVSASQKKLRSLVGSVTGIIQVNQFVAQGFIDKPTAINILMTSYGYDAVTAASMITSLTVDSDKPAPSTEIPKE